jgi:hypothetical protein
LIPVTIEVVDHNRGVAGTGRGPGRPEVTRAVAEVNTDGWDCKSRLFSVAGSDDIEVAIIVEIGCRDARRIRTALSRWAIGTN